MHVHYLSHSRLWGVCEPKLIGFIHYCHGWAKSLFTDLHWNSFSPSLILLEHIWLFLHWKTFARLGFQLYGRQLWKSDLKDYIPDVVEAVYPSPRWQNVVTGTLQDGKQKHIILDASGKSLIAHNLPTGSTAEKQGCKWGSCLCICLMAPVLNG